MGKGMETNEKRVLSGFEWETPEAKARWFQSLSMEERTRWLCISYNLALARDPHIVEKQPIPQAGGGVQVLSLKHRL
jgi:hypothetical protein